MQFPPTCDLHAHSPGAGAINKLPGDKHSPHKEGPLPLGDIKPQLMDFAREQGLPEAREDYDLMGQGRLGPAATF